MTSDPAAFRLLNEIGIIEQLARTRFERVMPHDLTLAQFSVLNRFVRFGQPASPLELARAFQVTKATMTNTLQRLEVKRLISVVPNPGDGRAKIIDITEMGRRARSDAIAAVGPELAKLEQVIGTELIYELLPRLARIRAYLDENRD
jgi:DNA-binding MarR family transcriptional regulator